jgi:hypothetical protein
VKRNIILFNSYHGGGSTMAAVICALDLYQEHPDCQLMSDMILNNIFYEYFDFRYLYGEFLKGHYLNNNKIILLDEVNDSLFRRNRSSVDYGFFLQSENIYWVTSVTGCCSTEDCLKHLDQRFSRLITDAFRCKFFPKTKLLEVKHSDNRGRSSFRKRIENVSRYWDYYNTLDSSAVRLSRSLRNET